MFNRSFLVGCGVSGGGPTEPHKFWRILSIQTPTYSGSPSTQEIEEIELRATIGGADQTVPGGIVTADSTLSAAPAYQPVNAIDNYMGAGGLEWASATGLGSWIAYEFPSPVIVREVAVGVPQSAINPNGLAFQYSDDGVNYSTSKEFTGISAFTAHVFKTFVLF